MTGTSGTLASDPSQSPAIEIRTVTNGDDLIELGAVLQAVWGTTEPIVNLEMARAIGHSGGYLAGAYAGRHGQPSRMVGASVGILARHEGQPALHSHITGLLPDARHTGVGRRMKLHQRAWAAEHDIDWITWTFDPLVRRNAWFNIAVLGADVHSYLPSFYGTMTDAINAGDESDRLYVAWNVAAPLIERPRDGREVLDPEFVSTPPDVVALRRSNPAEVAQWRSSTRQALAGALAAGRQVLGFTIDGNYVIGSAP